MLPDVLVLENCCGSCSVQSFTTMSILNPCQSFITMSILNPCHYCFKKCFRNMCYFFCSFILSFIFKCSDLEVRHHVMQQCYSVVILPQLTPLPTALCFGKFVFLAGIVLHCKKDLFDNISIKLKVSKRPGIDRICSVRRIFKCLNWMWWNLNRGIFNVCRF